MMATLPDRSRRDALRLAAGALALVVCRPAAAEAEALKDAIDAYARGRAVTLSRVTIEVARLVDNGNAVPVTVRVASPMTAADHVVAIALFSERNPERDVARFTLTPRTGRAEVAMRIRLATSQQLVAIATTSDGALWSGAVDVVVTLAACIEGEGMP